MCETLVSRYYSSLLPLSSHLTESKQAVGRIVPQISNEVYFQGGNSIEAVKLIGREKAIAGIALGKYAWANIRFPFNAAFATSVSDFLTLQQHEQVLTLASAT
ncbi:MAG: hypothetical protein AAF587_00730 [Bacteroidota bacterium]